MVDFEKGSQLKGYIQREVKEKNIHSNYGYTYYFTRKFLERAFQLEPEKFVLKGSYSQFTNIGLINRPITDIDLVIDKKIEDANKVILEIVNQEEKINFSIKDFFVTENATINYRIMCSFDNINHLIKIDLRKEKPLEKTNSILPAYFSKDELFNVNKISLEEHLANKLYIILLGLKLNLNLGKEFRRYKDFYDLNMILKYGEINYDKVKDYLLIRILNDNFLSEYELKGTFFDKSFALNNKDKWLEEAKLYNFNDQIDFSKTLEEINELSSRILK